ncbi:MAG: ABATE domain-containing protein [Thermoanaerobaculia bacterium]|nr:ABATE domain-containing protein [Thermoanaerobaculia bacterium]
MGDTAGQTFDLSGGALCLDFVNTWEDRGRGETDGLRSYDDLLAFAAQTGIVEAAQADELAARAAERPAAARRAFEKARSLRELLYRLFAARVADRDPETADLETLSAASAEAATWRVLSPEGEGFTWRWRALEGEPGGLLAPVAASATDLLTAGSLDRLRQCDAPRCTWLFLDASRNRSRRWCSMETCGNRAKARRHYRRVRGGS